VIDYPSFVSDIIEKDSVTAVEKMNDTTILVTVYYVQLTKDRPKKKNNNDNNRLPKTDPSHRNLINS